MMMKAGKMVEAYHISPRGYVIPVLHGTHISTVIQNPKVFGLTPEIIAEVYKRHKETMPKEGYARDEILTKLLKIGWIRARIKNGYLCCQVGFVNKRIYKNILKLFNHLKLVIEPQRFRAIGLRAYIVSENYIINEFDMIC